MEPRGERLAAQKGRAEIGHFIELMACLPNATNHLTPFSPLLLVPPLSV